MDEDSINNVFLIKFICLNLHFYDVGQVNDGLSKKALSKLPSSKYKIKSKEKNQYDFLNSKTISQFILI